MELYSLPGIPARMAADLRAAGLVTCDDMLRTSDVAVAAALRGSLHHAREVIGYVSGMAAPRPTTSLALAQRDRESRSTLPTGLPEVDAALRGGVPPSLTELCGPAGAGKTQACYTLAAAAASRPLLEGRDDADGVVWLDTEGAFSPDRLREVLVARHPALYGWDDGDEPAAADRARGRLADVLNHVVLFTPASLEELVDTLASPSMEATLSEARVRAIVVDSVAAVARRDYDGGKLGDMRRRTDLLARLSAALKVLADTFRLPVIVTNQVTTRILPAVSSSSASSSSTASAPEGSINVDEELLPALGTTWAHCVNTRLFLCSQPGARGGGGGQLTVMKSSVAPPVTAAFRITAAGLGPAGGADGGGGGGD